MKNNLEISPASRTFMEVCTMYEEVRGLSLSEYIEFIGKIDGLLEEEIVYLLAVSVLDIDSKVGLAMLRSIGNGNSLVNNYARLVLEKLGS